MVPASRPYSKFVEIEAPDEGRVMSKKDLTVGFLDQHGGLESDRSIWEEMREIFKPVLIIEKKMRTLENRLAEYFDEKIRMIC